MNKLNLIKTFLVLSFFLSINLLSFYHKVMVNVPFTNNLINIERFEINDSFYDEIFQENLKSFFIHSLELNGYTLSQKKSTINLIIKLSISGKDDFENSKFLYIVDIEGYKKTIKTLKSRSDLPNILTNSLQTNFSLSLLPGSQTNKITVNTHQKSSKIFPTSNRLFKGYFIFSSKTKDADIKLQKKISSLIKMIRKEIKKKQKQSQK